MLVGWNIILNETHPRRILDRCTVSPFRQSHTKCMPTSGRREKSKPIRVRNKQTVLRSRIFGAEIENEISQVMNKQFNLIFPRRCWQFTFLLSMNYNLALCNRENYQLWFFSSLNILKNFSITHSTARRLAFILFSSRKKCTTREKRLSAHAIFKLFLYLLSK